jgi:SAM-dependent methyltransferase
VCRSCGTSCRGEAPTSRARDSHYAGYYDDVPPLSPLTARRLAEWAASLRPFRRTGRILEVGCGAGHFLAAARDAGFEAWGTEISASGLARLRRDGFQVLAGELTALALPDSHFDAVVLFEVLEHLPGPRAYLEECRRVLRDGGLLFLTTPNFGSLSRRLLAERWRVIDPEHLVLFTRRGLRRTLEGAGFREAGIASRNVDPGELIRGLRRRPVLDTGERQARTDAVREALGSRPWLGAVKRAVNAGLRLLDLGDTLEARALR